MPGLPDGPTLDEREPEIDELLDALLVGVSTAEEIAGPEGLLALLTRRLLNRALEAELTAHLGYPAGQAPPGGAGNARNGQPHKTVLTDQGPLRIRSPRDRKGTFGPQIVKKRQTRWVGFDEKVISLYARGLTVREIQGHLAEIYGTEVSPDLISKITDAVLEDAKAWQNRPLERLYPIVYLDALVVKIRDGQAVRNFACYVAIGVNLQGERDVLGIWFQKTEGAKFWMQLPKPMIRSPSQWPGTARSSASAGRSLIRTWSVTKLFPRRVRALGTRSALPVRRQAVSSRRSAPRPCTYSDW